jgi:hypothetical protein
MRPPEGATGNRGEAVMNARDCLASVGAIALLILPLALAGPASADDCQLRMGPYASQSAAERGLQQARGVGFKTSGIWGEGDVVSQIANRQYFFNVLFAC